LDDIFLYAEFTASGRGENRCFAGYDNMFPGTPVLAYGETTGHSHRIANLEAAEFFELDGTYR
jgi:hypothetical protein